MQCWTLLAIRGSNATAHAMPDVRALRIAFSDPRWGPLVAEVKEGKDIPVGIGDLKAPQPLVYER